MGIFIVGNFSDHFHIRSFLHDLGIICRPKRVIIAGSCRMFRSSEIIIGVSYPFHILITQPTLYKSCQMTRIAKGHKPVRISIKDTFYQLGFIIPVSTHQRLVPFTPCSNKTHSPKIYNSYIIPDKRVQLFQMTKNIFKFRIRSIRIIVISKNNMYLISQFPGIVKYPLHVIKSPLGNIFPYKIAQVKCKLGQRKAIRQRIVHCCYLWNPKTGKRHIVPGVPKIMGEIVTFQVITSFRITDSFYTGKRTDLFRFSGVFRIFSAFPFILPYRECRLVVGTGQYRQHRHAYN